MTITVPWSHVEALTFVLACGLVGAVVGGIVGLVRKGERDG